MDHRPATMIFSAGILVAMALLFVIVPKGFIPTEDTGQIQGTTETLEGSSYEAMRDHQLAVADILRRDPYVDHFMSTVGGGTMNQGRVSLRLKPRGGPPPPPPGIRGLPPQPHRPPGHPTPPPVPPPLPLRRPPPQSPDP